MWFISRQLNTEREVCCDDLVVSSGYEPMDYAGALLRMAELCAVSQRSGALALSATGDNKPLLERRIERLMNLGHTPRLQLTRAGMAGLFLTLGLLIAAPGIARTWAQAQTWPSESELETTNNTSANIKQPDQQQPDQAEPLRIQVQVDPATGDTVVVAQRSKTGILLWQKKLQAVEVSAVKKGFVEVRLKDGSTVTLHAASGRTIKPTQVTEGTKLPRSPEDKLKWGEPVNGLRAAIAIRPASDKPTAGEKPELYLAVQNVTKAPIRLDDTSEAARLRDLLIKLDGEIMMVMWAKKTSVGNRVLQPREVVYVLMFPPETENPDERIPGSVFAEATLKDSRRSLVAKMNIENAPPGAWKGKLVTGETSGAVAAGLPQPNDEHAIALFKKWQSNARLNGNIPGGALGNLATATENFVTLNPTDERTPKLKELIKRMDTSHDWTPAEAVALLDDVTAIYASLPKWAGDLKRFSIAEIIRTGQPLPADLKDAPWGQPEPNGLRTAWLLDPRAGQHRINTPLKSRILFHNSGKTTVVFRLLTWNQSNNHKARDATGTDIRITSTSWTTIGQIFVCRLAPGEFTEVVGAGIGVGAKNKDNEDWRGTRVGSWIEASEGDEITFTPCPVTVSGKDGRMQPPGGPPWWLGFITHRLERDAPLPAGANERKRILSGAMRDLFGTPPTPEETAAFIADRSLDDLANRLAKRAGTFSLVGNLQSGETQFRVLAVDPEAAKKPRVATGPGRYPLGDQIRLVVSRSLENKRYVNEAHIRFFASDPTDEPPGKPHEIKLPDGMNTWAIAWERESMVLWFAKYGVLRSYDFTKPAKVKESRIENAGLADLPEPLRETLRSALESKTEADVQPAATIRIPKVSKKWLKPER